MIEPVDDRPQVRVRDAFVAYAGGGGTVMGLRGLDLTLSAGERLLVLGPNGSGKSTLLRVITGEQPLLAGTVEVGGVALHALDGAERRRWRARRVGFVDQHARRGLLPDLSVLDNTALQQELAGTARRPARAQAAATLERLGLSELAGRSVTELSGGEAQRVAVAAAVAHGPDLVLADEPSGELDEVSAALVHELLGTVAAHGAGVIIVSHDPRSTAFADRVVRIDAGRTAEQWTYPDGAAQPYREQLIDSRGWLRLPVDLVPELDDLSRLVPEAIRGGLLLSAGDAVPPDPGDAEVGEPTAVVGRPSAVAGRPVLAFRDVEAGYGSLSLFDHLDLEVVAGHWTLVTGPSGSGKSTLLALAAGLLDPRSGTVTVSDLDWSGLDRSARARLRSDRVAVVPQRSALVESLTVRENLALTQALRRRSDDAALADLVTRLDLVQLLDVATSALSGGERQRVSIARAALSPAPLLVLDEPTSQCDDANVGRVVALLEREAAAGRAILVASHDPRVVEGADHRVKLGAS